jgi:hypothetical protein
MGLLEYDLQSNQIIGGPAWLNQDRYEVVAMAEQSPAQPLALGADTIALLAENQVLSTARLSTSMDPSIPKCRQRTTEFLRESAHGEALVNLRKTVPLARRTEGPSRGGRDELR